MNDPRPNPFERLLNEDERWGPSAGVDEGFRRNTRQTPTAAAIQQGSLILTYADVDSLANEFAAGVLEHAAPEGSRPVILYARRSAALVVAMLGSVRAGRTFAVLDAAYPAERVRRQLAALSPALIVGIEVARADLRDICAGSDDVPSWSCTIGDLQRRKPSPRPTVDICPNPTAYLLFTSGTTGAPRCIRTGHAPLLHFLEFYRRRFRPGANDRFSMLSGLGHDPLLRDVFAPLSCGACIVVPDEAIVRSPDELYAWLADAGITFVHTTPQMLRLVSTGRAQRPPLTKLSHVFSGGDTLLRDCVAAVQSVAPNASIVNFYGSTETPQAMGFHVVAPEDADTKIPLGRGIDDVQMLVLGEDLRIADIGVIGQIGIRTHFLSSGYLNDSETTRTKFIASPFTADPNDRIYLTGDFGYYRPDGAVVGTGRQDDQVKIRGYRVELAEVTRTINATGLVTNCATIVHHTASGDSRLVAFVVADRAKSGVAHDLEASLRTALQTQLPAAMVPARIVPVDVIPLSPNGKLDQQALARLLEGDRRDSGRSLRHSPELSEPLRTLISKIEDSLETTVDSLDRSFIDLGGDSLSYIRVCSAIQDAVGSLPRDWASRPLREFSAKSKSPEASSLWTQVELPILLRAISIVLIVMAHAGICYYPATSVLFVVSGVSFGRFLAPTIRRTGDLGPLLRFILRFGIPATLWQLLRSVWNHELWLPNLLLLGTYFKNSDRPFNPLWYLDVLAANVLMLGLSVRLGRRLRSVRSKSMAAGSTFTECLLFVVMGVAMALAQLKSGWGNGDIVLDADPVAPFRWFWMLALGMAIVEAHDRAKRVIVTLLAIAILVLVHVVAGGNRWFRDDVFTPFFVGSVILLQWIPSVPLPRFIQRPVVIVAQSTLFIYILDFALLNQIMPRIGLPSWPVLAVGVPILVGIVATRVWERVQRFAALAVERIRTTRTRHPQRSST